MLKGYDNTKEKSNNLSSNAINCLMHRKKTKSKNPSVAKIKKGKLMLLSKHAIFGSKKMIFIKEQENSGLLRSSFFFFFGRRKIYDWTVFKWTSNYL